MEIINFQKNGFIITNSSQAKEVLKLKHELNNGLIAASTNIIKQLMPGYADDIHHIDNIVDLLSFIHLHEIDNKVTRACYEVFPSLPVVIGLINHPLVLKLANFAGISFPQASTIPVVRLDRPGENFRLTPWHRDYWFNMLSENSIVIWFSLSELDKNMGLLKVIPGSHNFGFIPFRKRNGPEPFEPVMDYDSHADVTEIDVKYDEFLIFDQKLLH